MLEKGSRLLFHAHRTNFARNVAYLGSLKKGAKNEPDREYKTFLGWPLPRCGACRRKVAHLPSRSEARLDFSSTLRSICLCFHVKNYYFRPNLLTDVHPALSGATFGPTSVLFLKTTRFTVNLSKRKHIDFCLVLFAPKYNFSHTLLTEK